MTVSAILLAAGRGSRMGGPKHLLPIGGRPMLLHVIDALRGSRTADVRVVLRPGDDDAVRELEAAGVAWVAAETEDEGRAASVRAGVRASPEENALLFALADQPYLRAEDFDALIDGLSQADLVRASYAGQPGSPALFAPVFRGELLALRGSEGGRAVLARHAGRVLDVALDPERGRDLDRPEDLR